MTQKNRFGPVCTQCERWHGFCNPLWPTEAGTRIPCPSRAAQSGISPHLPGNRTWKDAMAMNLITAIIRPYKLDDLEMAVAQLGVQGMTVVEVQGYGAEHGHSEVYRGAQYRIDFVPRTQVQIAVDETIVEPVIEAIANVTRTGKVGDGRIFVSGLAQAIRIRTGETGVAAA